MSKNVWYDLVEKGKDKVDSLIEEWGAAYNLEDMVYMAAGNLGSGFGWSELYDFLRANPELGGYRSSFGAETIDDILEEAVVETLRYEMITYMRTEIDQLESDEDDE